MEKLVMTEQTQTQQLAEPTQKEKKSFLTMLESMKPQLAAALPKHLSPDRMVRVALTCYRMTPALRECTPESVIGAIVQCAQLGLEPGLLGQAWMIPFKRNQKQPDGSWKSWKECQFIPGYKGLIALARRSGEVTSISTEIVYEKDKFKLTLGVEPNVEHEPYLEGDRGKPRLVYGVAKFKDGGYHLEWMGINDVEKIRLRSKAKDDGPWKTDYEQMVRKTVIRRMSNYLPMSVELASAIAVSDAHDDGRSAKLVLDGEYMDVTTSNVDEGDEPPPDRGTAGLKDKVGGIAPATTPVPTQVEHNPDEIPKFNGPKKQAEPAQQQRQEPPNPQAQQQPAAQGQPATARKRPTIGAAE
jgi:recombination protein RecT